MRIKSTKEQILIVARKLFVEHGYAGTSIGNIAKLAEVNHSLIFHHFGNKEKLWIAVKQKIVQEANQQNKTLPDTNLPFNKFLPELVISTINFYENNFDIIRMINWQRLERDNDLTIGVTLSTEMQAWINAVKYYQQRDDINPDLKPEFIVTFILSIISSAALDPNIFINNKKDFQAYIDFCVKSILKALD